MRDVRHGAVVRAIVIAATLSSMVSSAWCNVTITGDVEPDNSVGWHSTDNAYIGKNGFGGVVVDDDELSADFLFVGFSGHGELEITNGGEVSNNESCIARYPGSKGEATVSGPGSIWNISEGTFVGLEGVGELNIIDGASVISPITFVGAPAGSTGTTTVSGSGSELTSSHSMTIGFSGQGSLHIEDGGLVSTGLDPAVAPGNMLNGLYIDLGDNGDSFITMATGGMLAVYGDGGASLGDFLDLISSNSKDIRYWNSSIADWDHITAAEEGTDYTLSYLTAGALAGHTMLTVNTIPEPATVMLLAIGGLAVLRRRRIG